jgi:hypothetical protein
LIYGLSTLTDEQLTCPGAQGDWSVKDILSHIAAWERLATDRLTAAFSGTEPTYPLIHNWDDIHKFNATCFQENLHKSLADVLKDTQDAFLRFLDIVTKLDDDFIAKALPFDWADGMTAFELIATNSYLHYKEHREALENWLNNL